MNQGTIAADQSGGTLTVTGTLGNLLGGTTSVASGATLTAGPVSNSGTITIAGGGTLNAGTFGSNIGAIRLDVGGGGGGGTPMVSARPSDLSGRRVDRDPEQLPRHDPRADVCGSAPDARHAVDASASSTPFQPSTRGY